MGIGNKLVGSKQQQKYKQEAIADYRKQEAEATGPNFQTITLHIRGTSPLVYKAIFRQATFFCSGDAADTNN